MSDTTHETRSSGAKTLLVAPLAFVGAMWGGYVAYVKAVFPPIAPGDDDGDLVLMFPFLFLSFVTLIVMSAWLIAVIVVLLKGLAVHPRTSPRQSDTPAV